MFQFVSSAHIDRLKDRLQRPVGEYAHLRFELEHSAEIAMTEGPWSVTFSPPGAITGDPHDYYSIGPYWWPDPTAADPKTAPYIRRDGEVNPERFIYNHRQDFIALSYAALTLCTAGYFFNRRDYLDKAAEFYRIWFVATETKMNPHLEYAQAIQNICCGRGIGIIELHGLDRIVFTLGFLDAAGGYEKLVGQIEEWLNEMLDWLINSNHGIEESKNGNNHETHYFSRIGMCALRLGRKDGIEMMCRNYKERILPLQLEPDGSMPHELGRTRSLHYSIFNLDAMAMLCELAKEAGDDSLWGFKADNRSMELAIDYLAPAMANPYLWQYKEIHGEIPAESFALHFAADRLNRPDLAKLNNKLREGKRLWRKQVPIAPICLFEGFNFDEKI